MKINTPINFMLIAMIMGTFSFLKPDAVKAVPIQQDGPLRASESLETITSDLKSFIPAYMDEQNIPGVAIALIQDNRVAWQQGFGAANALTGSQMNTDSIFRVASNSKVVAAYIALRLVDQGTLSLDKPMNAYLDDPWLPESGYREAITLRNVLSHSAGLGHSTASRESLFAPGRGYSYSAIGYQYLQAVIEQVSGQPLEAIAQELVFEPLGMESSSYTNPAAFIPRNANGHVHAILPVLLFGVMYLISLLVVGLVSMVLIRLRTGRWRPRRRRAVGVLLIAMLFTLLAAFVLFGMSELLEFAILIAFCGLSLVVVFTLAYLSGSAIITRLLPERAGLRSALSITWGILLIVTISLLAGGIANLPVPKWAPTQADAAGSMRATAGDLATFLIELSDPQLLSTETAEQMRTPQLKLSSDMSWGLGPGIQHSSQGDALWQWGQHIDFQSIMIIYPDQGFGVVVLTNNDLFNPDVALEIARRALGGKTEPIRRAIHLQFNYREQ